MTEEKMEKAMLCEEELDKVAGGRPRAISGEYKREANSVSLSEELEKLMGDSDYSKMEYEVRK